MSKSIFYQSKNQAIVIEATIAATASLSETLNVRGYGLVGIYMPAQWTAADLTFQMSPDGVTLYDVHDSTGAELEVTADAGNYVAIDPAVLPSCTFLKVRSGTSALAVAQADERKVLLVFREVH